MSTQVRKFWVVLALAGVFLAGVSLAVKHVLLANYAVLEQDAIRQSTEQVVKALQAEMRQIAVVGNDYASWDDMYAFVRDRNPKFPELNFSKLGLREMEVEVVYVVDESGREVYSTEQRPEGDVFSVPATEPIRAALRAQLPQVLKTTSSTSELNLLRLPGGVGLVTANPIIQTDRTGPARGTLILVRILGATTIERMAGVSQLPVALWDLAKAAPADAPAQVRAWGMGAASAAARQTFALGPNDIAGYARLNGVGGTPLLVIGTRTPRAVYNKGRETAMYLLSSIAAMLALVLVVTFVLDRKLHKSNRKARANELLYRAVVEQAEEGIVLFDPVTQGILQCNPAMTRLSGFALGDILRGGMDALIAPSMLPLFWSLLEEAGHGARPPVELGLRRADGSTTDVEISANPVALYERRVICLLIRDVSQRKLAEVRLLDHQHKLEHLANHDPLTGLPNRLYLNFRLPGLIDQAERDRASLAVCYIDVDNFKNINDSSGHDTGDEVLRTIADKLRHIVSRDDLVARISGDEFVVVSVAKDASVFDAVSRRIIEHLRQAVTIGGRDYAVSISMGVAVFPRDGASAPELLRSADIALYQAKDRGKDNAQFFAHEMNARVNERAQLEQQLRIALAEGQISVHYQPVVDLRNERIAGLEALARWRHPELGDIPPIQFIPVAEEAGLIVELGEVVLNLVCAQIRTWTLEQLPVVPVAVNVSVQQLQRSNIRDRILAISAAHDVAPQMLQVELTESAVMREIDRQIGAIESLRSSGVRVSIDDFGTGYSSLSYLKHLPIDHLKIDRSFVRDMAVDANDAAIVSAIINMARSLKIETIAEGVETAQHALRLASLGCDYAQGYYYSAPLPAAECGRLLAEIGRRTKTSETTRLRVAGTILRS